MQNKQTGTYWWSCWPPLCWDGRIPSCSGTGTYPAQSHDHAAANTGQEIQQQKNTSVWLIWQWGQFPAGDDRHFQTWKTIFQSKRQKLKLDVLPDDAEGGLRRKWSLGINLQPSLKQKFNTEKEMKKNPKVWNQLKKRRRENPKEENVFLL